MGERDMMKATKKVIELIGEGLEIGMSIMIIAVILIMSFYLVTEVFADPKALRDSKAFMEILETILNFAIGIELIRMLIRHTMNDVIEVLILALSRHMVVTSQNAAESLIQVLAIAVLFAVRRYLLLHRKDIPDHCDTVQIRTSERNDIDEKTEDG